MDDLELNLSYVETLCERAIAQGWDSGRLGYTSPSPLPFEEEVEAILRPKHGLARDQLRRADERLAAIKPHAPNLAQGLQSPSSGPTRLSTLAAEFGLSELATTMLAIIAAPSLRGELARLYAIIANDPDRPLCDEFLIGQILSYSVPGRGLLARELDSSSPLIRYGLVRLGAGQRPFAELAVEPLVIRRLQGVSFVHSDPDSPLELRPADLPLERLIVPRPILAEIRSALTRGLRQSIRLAVRGRLGSGRRSLLAAAVEEQGKRMALLDLNLLAPYDEEFPNRLRAALREAVLRGWWPCVTGLECVSGLEGERRERTRAVLRQHPGPLLFRCSPEVSPPLAPGYRLFDLPPLTEAQRTDAFRSALVRCGLNSDSAETLAAKYRIGPGLIEKVIVQVSGQVSSQVSGQVSAQVLGQASKHPGQPDRIEQALRQHRDEQIGQFATRMTRLADWDQMVLPDDIKDSISEFIGRIRHRQLVHEAWGLDRVLTSARGLTALFQGGPGTGKSMVAGLIARELGYELYRVDLSRILSKWIGETEQNLGKLFDIAEDGQVIILFDEADALFTKRTEVSTSVDRYANAEVNYLLQRLDTFEGIAILTTNLDKSIDSAFKRRLSMRLTFPFPDEDMREDLWRVHLPNELPISGPLDLRQLAERYELSGGYIRNAVLRAAFLAAMDKTAVTQWHLECAVRLEYRERGMLIEGGILE